MLNFARWQTIGIIASVLIAILLALPNVLPKDMQDRLRPYGLRPVTLGLDLQGGINILLEIDRDDLRRRLGDQIAGDIRASLREAKIGYNGINRFDNGVRVRITKPEDIERANVELKKLIQPLDTGFFGAGTQASLFDIDLQDQQFTFTFNEAGVGAKIASAISQSIKIVEKRVNPDGVVEATIQQQGKERITIQLPGVQDSEEIKKRLNQTAKLTFQLLCESQATAEGQNPPPDCRALPLKEDPKQILWVQTSSRATVDGADLVDARPSFDQQNQPVVSFRFNTKGAERFAKLTRDNVGKPFAIILDDIVVSYPRINEAILGGSGQISGNFTSQEASDLAIVLRSGALPAKLTIVEERTVGPSLGSDSIKAGFNASIIGLVLVIAFMMVAYGVFGIFANLALLINLVMLLGVMSFFRIHADLAGHRRHSAHHGHGGRLQRHHIRAHARGMAQRPHGTEFHRDRLQVGLRHHFRFELHRLHRRRRALRCRFRPSARLRHRPCHRHPHHRLHRLYRDPLHRFDLGAPGQAQGGSALRAD